MKCLNINILKKYYLELMLVCLIFLGGIIDDDIILVINIMMLFLLKRKVRLSEKQIALFSIFILQSIISVIIGHADLLFAIKQLTGIITSIIVFYTYIRDKKQVYIFFLVYKHLSILMAILCICQQIAFRIKFIPLYDLTWLVHTQRNLDFVFYRSYAIFNEPSQTSLILLPIASIALYRLFGKYKKSIYSFIDLWESIVMLIGFLCIFSTAGYCGLFTMVLLILLQYRMNRKQLLFIIGCVILLTFIWINDPGFRMRIVDSIVIFKRDANINEYNLSTQAIFINLKVALKSVIESIGLGNGIGSHPISYDRFSEARNFSGFLLNRMDAGALFTRILSELGVWGICLFFGYIYKFRPNRNDLYGVIGMSCLSYIIQRLLKSPHGFNDGLWMIMISYYVCHKLENNQI